MKKILITGFMPFDNHKENSSQIITEMFSTAQIDGLDIRTKILPVTFENSFKELKSEIDLFQPDYVVSLGLAGNRKHIELEKVAINLIHCRIKDNDGVMLQDLPIEKEGAAAYFSTLPLKAMRETDTPFSVRMSFSAGTYVCNFLMYQTLKHFEGSKTKAGFIHLPHLGENREAVFETVSILLRSLIYK